MIAAILAGVIAATSFDLECKGEVTYDTGTAPYTHRYRVDLGTNRWCDGECSAVFRLPQVDDNSITFWAERDGPDKRWDVWVNRRTGVLTERMSLVVKYTSTAQCERRPFSGFPEKKF